jgi:L-alanine-DL-glutamate epimerase-like enolase superfamily enzyme
MRITGLTTEIYQLRFPQPVYPAWTPGMGWSSSEVSVFRVETDEGLIGIGAGAGSPAYVRDVVAPRLVGQDPFETERITNILRDHGGPWLGHTSPWGIELAIWDLIGKCAGLPVSRMWGRYTDRILGYASTIEIREPKERAEDALRLLERGYKAIKLRLHSATIAEDIAQVRAVRDAVGDRMEIMVDANQAERPGTPQWEEGPVWNYQRAVTTCRELAKLQVSWVEEPLGRYNHEGLARLASAVDVPLAGGESGSSLQEFRELIDRNCFTIVQPDAIVSEGLGQLRKVAAYAEMHHKLCVPHHGGNGFAVAAHLQFSASCPNSPYIEIMQDPPRIGVMEVQGLITEPFDVDAQGYVRVPDGPGLGVEISDRWQKIASV